ncbi:hypothetical protein BH24DEI2_BH24DEI2_27920 [soil metagenome]
MVYRGMFLADSLEFLQSRTCYNPPVVKRGYLLLCLATCSALLAGCNIDSWRQEQPLERNAYTYPGEGLSPYATNGLLQPYAVCAELTDSFGDGGEGVAAQAPNDPYAESQNATCALEVAKTKPDN